jgi:hypothetical protein
MLYRNQEDLVCGVLTVYGFFIAANIFYSAFLYSCRT